MRPKSLAAARSALLAVAVAAGGCQCREPSVKAAEVLRAVPSPVDFGNVEVGDSKTLEVSVENVGRATLDVRVAGVPPPFFLHAGPEQSTLRPGQALRLLLRFSPTRAGAEESVLRLEGAGGNLGVPLVGTGVVCASANPCASSKYDVAAQACVETPRPDGWPCANACGGGRCTGGACVAGPEVCDDGLGCTSDSCDAEAGCRNALACADDGDVCTTEVCLADGGCGAMPLSCDDGNPCTEDGCNAGCFNAVLPDETPCAAPTCETHYYCSSGACTPVEAPDAGPCGCHPQIPLPPRLAVGTGNACRVTPDKFVECWGNDTCGMLGAGTVNSDGCVEGSPGYYHTQPKPLRVQGLSDVEEISGGNYNVFCARTSGGDVYCWGNNHTLVAPSPPWWIVPPKKMPLANAVALSVGEQHACAVLADGTVWCWGANLGGELGMGYAGSYTPDAGCIDCWRLNPVRVVGITNAVRVSATGHAVTCAMLADSTVRCWGVNLIPGGAADCMRKWGSYYDPRFATHKPVLLQDIDGRTLYGITKIFTGSAGNTCALDMYGRLSCVIGEPRFPVLEPLVGIENCELFVPVDVSFCASRFRLTVGGWAFRLRDGTARVLAGSNDAGALGTGDYEPAYDFREVSGLHDAEEVELEFLYGCATLADGGFRCWGDNTFGQLGDGTYVSRPAP